MLKKFNLLLLICCTLAMRAELLIVKQTPTGFEPLSAEESARAVEVISPILLKYQWPMVIASDLTEEEQNELLTPGGEPYKEARFIEAKIRAFGGEFENYRVVFIPTSLYELFVLRLYFEARSYETPLNRAVDYFRSKWYEQEDIFKLLFSPKELSARELDSRICRAGGIVNLRLMAASQASKKTAVQIKEMLNLMYQDTNEFFWNRYSYRLVNAGIYVNNALVNWLFKNNPDLNTATNLGESIKLMSLDSSMQSLLIKELSVIKWWAWDNYIGSGVGNEIIKRVVFMEYEAAELNKAMLLRGTRYEYLHTCLGLHLGKAEEKECLAGTTILKGDKPLYSISLANSLFAGIKEDPTACAYNFLVRFANEGRVKREADGFGFALLINKKDYYQHRLSRLFFIPALGTLPALFDKGEYFHPRTTVAVPPALRSESLSIRGLFGGAHKDPSSIVLITRDPLHHAELFSKFLTENARVLDIDSEGVVAIEPSAFAEKAIRSQEKASKFYKVSRFIKQKFKGDKFKTCSTVPATPSL